MAEAVMELRLRGGNRAAYDARDKEILVSGPAGTGKTRTILELLNNLCHSFPGVRALIVRKHQVTLTTTCLVTFNAKVLTPDDGVAFFGGSKSEPAAYRYPNGSIITVGGMDNPEKLLSSEYDIVYANEATELTLEDWEVLTSRLRNGVLQFMRIIGDCNPSTDKHWLLLRCNAGVARHIRTRIQDNPAYFDDAGVMTPAGESYLATLENLTGTRRQRLLLGEWVGMENAIYGQLDPAIHLGSTEAVRWEQGVGAIGIDYGRVHNSAVVAVQKDTDGVWWVRECWAAPGGNPQEIEDMSRGMKLRYKIRRGRVDPNQEYMGQNLGFNVAKGNAGSRKARIGLVTELLDGSALMFDQDGKGVRDLFDEALAYRYEIRETDTEIDDVVVRKDDDRVAAMEYAIEELLSGRPSLANAIGTLGAIGFRRGQAPQQQTQRRAL